VANQTGIPGVSSVTTGILSSSMRQDSCVGWVERQPYPSSERWIWGVRLSTHPAITIYTDSDNPQLAAGVVHMRLGHSRCVGGIRLSFIVTRIQKCSPHGSFWPECWWDRRGRIRRCRRRARRQCRESPLRCLQV